MMQRLLLAAGAGLAAIAVQRPALGADRAAVVETYADIAQAMYEDSLVKAQQLREAIVALVEAPGDDTLQAARDAWLAARVPYQQTEV